MRIKLRCLKTHEKYGEYNPGDICEVTKLYINDSMTKGVITIECDGNKTTGPFRFSEDKALITKTEAFRVRAIPSEA
jgi:hypothetical protein